jgi:hypothetical protein
MILIYIFAAILAISHSARIYMKNEIHRAMINYRTLKRQYSGQGLDPATSYLLKGWSTCKKDCLYPLSVEGNGILCAYRFICSL